MLVIRKKEDRVLTGRQPWELRSCELVFASVEVLHSVAAEDSVLLEQIDDSGLLVTLERVPTGSTFCEAQVHTAGSNRLRGELAGNELRTRKEYVSDRDAGFKHVWSINSNALP